MDETKQVWVYLRKSRALGDPDDPKLLEHHLAALQRLAAREGLALPPERIIQEVGSAETIRDRPRFAALVAEWEQLPEGTGGVVLVTELERLSRGSLAERGRIVDALSLADIHVLTLSRRYDLRNPDDATWFTIFSELGKRELAKFKERLALKLAELLDQGRSRNGRAPYCYQWDPKIKNWIAHPDRFPIVQAWCEEIAYLSLRRIGEKWGVPRWIVHDTLSNPAICGWPAKRTGKHKGRRGWKSACDRLPREEWVWPSQAGSYPPVCSRAQWEQIQQEIGRRREGRAKVYANENAWCRDLVRFAADPEARVHLSCDTNLPADHPDRLTYIARRTAGPRLYVPRRLVHAAAEAALREVFAAPGLITAALAHYHESRATSPPPGPSTRALVEERDRGSRRLVDLLRREIDEESEVQQQAIAALRRQTEAEIRRLDAQLQAAAAAGPAEPHLDALLPLLTEHLPHLETWWPRAPDHLKRQITNALLEGIRVVTEPATGQRAWRREVEAVRLAPWLSDYVRLSSSASGSNPYTTQLARLRPYCQAA